ncbi:MAG: SGNH/GDSL hydrolase family protein [Janthinobacterium lividum]
MGTSRTGRAVLVTALLTAACGTVPATPAVRTPAPSSAASPSPTATPSPTASTTLDVVGLGDSVTSGEHCDCDDYVTGFGHLLARRTGVKIHVTDDGESGSTSDGLADELSGTGTDDRDLQSDVAGADVVVITMGANDLAPALSAWRSGSCTASCYDPEVAQMRSDLGRLLDRVGTLADGHAGVPRAPASGTDPGGEGGRPPHVRVLVTTYWNVFTDGDVARKAERPGYLAWSDAVTRQANVAITRVADAHAATLVDLYAPFKGAGGADPTALLADDGDHPDAAGTALISRTVLAAYESGS